MMEHTQFTIGNEQNIVSVKRKKIGVEQVVFPISHVYDNRYFRYSLQLNMYRKILQDNYNGYKVSSLYTVRFHPNAQYKSFELVEMEIMEREFHDVIYIQNIHLEHCKSAIYCLSQKIASVYA